MTLTDRIEIDPEVMLGKPVIRGTRIPVELISPRAKDPAVLGLARSEARVLLTEDKDFGFLAYAGGHETAGVLLIRFPNDARSGLEVRSDRQLLIDRVR